MKKLPILGFLLISMVACQNKTNNTDTKEPIATETKAAEAQKESEFPEVTLNNGQLWQANPETTQGIRNLERILKESPKSESSAKLKEKLEVEFALIFKKCTMTGAAHDQLHNYLFPLKMKINAFEEGNKEKTKNEIKQYLEDYSTFFK